MVEANETPDAFAITVLNGLSRQELHDWLLARLHGDDMGISIDVRQDERPYSLIARIYVDLDQHVRDALSNIVAEFVYDLARNPQAPWQGNAAHELLLLAQSVCTDTSINDLTEMARDERFFSAANQERGSDLHYRVLQTLLALGWSGQPEFWQRQVFLSSDRYIGVAFNALAHTQIKEAIDLLVHIEWTAEVELRVLRSLPDWIDKHRNSGIMELLGQALPQMSIEAQNAIIANLSRHNITLPTGDSPFQPPRKKWKNVTNRRGLQPSPLIGGMKRLPIYLLLDCSGSMRNAPIKAVKNGLNRFIADVRRDSEAAAAAHIALITFSNEAEMRTNGLVPVDEFVVPSLVASGKTCLGKALQLLAHSLDRDVRYPVPNGSLADYKPLAFILTDGEPTDVEVWPAARAEILNRVMRKRVTVVLVGCGPLVDRENLRIIALDERLCFLLTDTASSFDKFFDLVSQSVLSYSQTVTQSNPEKDLAMIGARISNNGW